MTYSHEVLEMCKVNKGPHHGPAPIPEEGKWVKAYDVKDISGFTHGIGWCDLSRVLVSSLSMLRKVSSKKHLLKQSAAQV